MRTTIFVRKLRIDYAGTHAELRPCPIHWIDSFSMRNFTNDAIFDDTLPIADGLLEAGNRVPLDLLQQKMEDWFRRKGYLTPTESLRITELTPP